MKTAFTVLLCVGLSLSVAASAPNDHVAGKIPPGGEGWRDYLAADAPAQRLHVSRGTHVAVWTSRRGAGGGRSRHGRGPRHGAGALVPTGENPGAVLALMVGC
jgi:hypothetical protein